MESLISEVEGQFGKLPRRLRSALTLVDRAHFVPEEHSNFAYEDRPLSIGAGQTISAPHMHARMLKELEPSLPEGERSLKALDVGAGSGYMTACLRQLVGAQGLVVGVEVVPSLFQRANESLRRWNNTALEDGTIKLIQGNVFEGNVYGEVQKLGPYNAIHVGAAASADNERAKYQLFELLKTGGLLIMPSTIDPTQPTIQRLRKYSKTDEGEIIVDNLANLKPVRFVPLVPHDSRDPQNATLQSAETVSLEHRWPPTPDSPEEPLMPSQDHVEEPRRRHCPCCCCVS